MMRRLKKRMREEGPISPADLDSERVIGGFNTIKLTTRALDYLFYLGETQIAGRTKHFHRQFDLTEKVAPELLAKHKPTRTQHLDFFVRSAASVLKLATRRAAGRTHRASHRHLARWRPAGRPQGGRPRDQARRAGGGKLRARRQRRSALCPGGGPGAADPDRRRGGAHHPAARQPAVQPPAPDRAVRLRLQVRGLYPASAAPLLFRDADPLRPRCRRA